MNRKVSTTAFIILVMVGLLTALSVTFVHADQLSDIIVKGKYLTAMGDCQACHTASGGVPFAGGLYMNTPFGKISTPNITPDRGTGIGAYTDEQFLHVFHSGVGKDGEYLYPVMPFPWYTKVKDEDILAIKAYLFSLQPVSAPREPLEIGFPVNVRAALAAWDAAFLREGRFESDPMKSEEVNRGAYIVEGLEHCGECHDSRNMLGAGAIAKPLQGGEIDHWYAPDITSDVRTGIGRYSDAQLFSFLKTGTAAGMGTVVGPMAQTVHESLSQLTDKDVHAIVAYLKSTPPKAAFTPAVPAGLADPTAPGVQTYLNHCASCHQLDGKGIANIIPALAGNGLVGSAGPQSVIRVIVGGIEAQGTYGPMAAVGNGMTDQEVADATNYVRSAWSNAAPANVGPGEVAIIRKETLTYLNGTLPNKCPALAQNDMAEFTSDRDVQLLLQGTTEGNMLQNVNALLRKIKSEFINTSQADIVNSLTIAYCIALTKNASLNPGQRLSRLNQFGERVYTQSLQIGKD